MNNRIDRQAEDAHYLAYNTIFCTEILDSSPGEKTPIEKESIENAFLGHIPTFICVVVGAPLGEETYR